MHERITQFWNYLKVSLGLPLMILIAVSAVFFSYTFIRDWQTRRMVEQQNERMAAYDRQTQQFVKTANDFLSKSDANHTETVALLDAVKDMSSNLQQMAARDREITVKMAPIKNDYENARNQKSSNIVRSRPNVSIRQRETDALSADRELYPN